MKVGTRKGEHVPEHIRHMLLANAIVEGKTRDEAAKIAGYGKWSGNIAIRAPEVQRQVEAGLANAALAASVTRSWVISKLKEVAERCMQSRPVLDKLGHETGLYVFDSSGANRSLELLGKHLRIFGDDASAQAQLGAAVIRVLAQEAQAGRMQPQSIDAQIVTGPIEQEKTDGTNTSLPASVPPPINNRVSPPLSP